MNDEHNIEFSVPKFCTLDLEGCPEETDNISLKLCIEEGSGKKVLHFDEKGKKLNYRINRVLFHLPKVIHLETTDHNQLHVHFKNEQGLFYGLVL